MPRAKGRRMIISWVDSNVNSPRNPNVIIFMISGGVGWVGWVGLRSLWYNIYPLPTRYDDAYRVLRNARCASYVYAARSPVVTVTFQIVLDSAPGHLFALCSWSTWVFLGMFTVTRFIISTIVLHLHRSLLNLLLGFFSKHFKTSIDICLLLVSPIFWADFLFHHNNVLQSYRRLTAYRFDRDSCRPVLSARLWRFMGPCVYISMNH